MLSPATVPPDFRERVAPFLSAHGFAGDCAIEPVTGGGNNRVYRVQTADRAGLLKAYFQNPADPRDRFGAERAFYEYLWAQGVRRTPEPLGWDGEQRLGLFTFVVGRKLRAEEINPDSVAQALAFIAELNASRTTPAARQLPLASEACFSVSDHLACVERRVARLAQIESASRLEREAVALVADELKPAWQKIRAAIGGQIREDQPLPEARRCLSPSDFGFHNALLADDGRLQFFDFEYSGWDDPAKLACDFFCQPELQADIGLWSDFVGRLTATLSPDLGFGERARRLLPAYQIKWCCIMLNDFLAADRSRREFALGNSLEDRQTAQLKKAHDALRQLRLWA
jgi:Ser/Thr protein kinase RdoA (MazF antagonist)